MTAEYIIPVLQGSISPVILISAVGLLLLTMNNRLTHIIDRARSLSVDLAAAQHGDARDRFHAQLIVIWQRAQLVRWGIECAALSALVAAVLIVLLFVGAFGGALYPRLASTAFMVSLLFLIASLILFIADLRKSLVALRLELQGTLGDRGLRQ